MSESALHPNLRPNLRIEASADGSQTVHHDGFREHYHSRFGAVTQARRVYLEGTDTHRHAAPFVVEIGFGVGLNFRTTLADCLERGVFLRYVAFEIAPVASSLLQELRSYPLHSADPWLDCLSAWDPRGFSYRAANLDFQLIVADVTLINELPSQCTALYLDPFSPQVNPAPWQPSCLLRYATALAPGGHLATYCAAGFVRRGLTQAGLRVERGSGLIGKREFLRAIKAP